MVDAFNLLIQLSLAVIGGFIWLKMHPNAKEAASLFPLVCWLLPVLAVFTIIHLLYYFQSWWGFRRVEAELLERPDLKPTVFSARLVTLRCVIVAAVAIGGFLVLR